LIFIRIIHDAGSHVILTWCNLQGLWHIDLDHLNSTAQLTSSHQTLVTIVARVNHPKKDMNIDMHGTDTLLCAIIDTCSDSGVLKLERDEIATTKLLDDLVMEGGLHSGHLLSNTAGLGSSRVRARRHLRAG
jgi:hypothetical protein